MAVIDCPEFNFQRINILLLVSPVEFAVPNVQVKVPPFPFINEPKAHPGSAVVGIPAPLYAWNIFAQPLTPDNDDVQELLSGIQTQQPE